MKNKKNRASQPQSNNSQQLISQSISYSGPIPHPSDLARYEEIFPGAAERIIKMAENQATHRQELEKKVIDSGIKNSNKGLNFGLFVGIGGFILVGWLAYLGETILAGIIGTLDLASLVGVFVYGSIQRKKERIEKEEIAQKR